MRRILITGATGFIGRHLVDALVLEQDVHVTLLVREPYGMGQPLPAPLNQLRRDQLIELQFADLRTFGMTRRAVSAAKPDVVYHLAAAGATDPFMQPELALRHNTNGFINLARACFEKQGERPITRFIMARTPGEDWAMNAYAASKLAAWGFARMYARMHAWPIYGAKIFQCIGPGQAQRAVVPAAIQAALQNTDFPMTSGKQKRDWIYVSDIVEGLRAMLDAPTLNPGVSLDLGSGQAVSVREVVERIYILAQSQAQPKPGAIPGRPGEVPHQMADVEASAAALNWRAKVSLDDALRACIAAQQA